MEDQEEEVLLRSICNVGERVHWRNLELGDADRIVEFAVAGWFLCRKLSLVMVNWWARFGLCCLIFGKMMVFQCYSLKLSEKKEEEVEKDKEKSRNLLTL